MALAGKLFIIKESDVPAVKEICSTWNRKQDKVVNGQIQYAHVRWQRGAIIDTVFVAGNTCKCNPRCKSVSKVVFVVPTGEAAFYPQDFIRPAIVAAAIVGRYVSVKYIGNNVECKMQLRADEHVVEREDGPEEDDTTELVVRELED